MYLWERSPYSPPPAMLQGGQVPGGGGAEPRRAGRRALPASWGGAGAAPAANSRVSPFPQPRTRRIRARPGKGRAFEGDCWGSRRRSSRARLLVLSGRPSQEAGLELDPPSFPSGRKLWTLCAAVRGEKRKALPPNSRVRTESSQANQPGGKLPLPARDLLQPRRPESGLRRPAASRW